ncbi:uncharacterized protein [Anabrus simplex]|uniref:uncharacterized protein isoform X2 n=1 Tax=Anabrus simplex TaxID=316456 RepID=UPI0035A2D73A
MDQKVNVKEEPVWLEGTTNTSLENFEREWDMISLKPETKSELTEPGPTQENTFESSVDIKEEIVLEQQTVDLLVPYIKEENNCRELYWLSNDLEIEGVISTRC